MSNYDPVWAAEWRERNREKIRAYHNAWRTANRARDVQMNREERTRLKDEAIARYSDGTCSCVRCGFNDPRALQIDHINDDGADQRREVGGSRTSAGTTFYRWLRRNKYPDGYQVLCANCNWIKEIERRNPPI